MRILLTNDDGILAPGLVALYRELVTLGQVSVAAPDTVQSASGHAITINTPLMVKKVHAHDAFHGWAVAGRPADCVKLAVGELLEHPPDLVVSGINDGANVGINVLYSGTVAAAAEGAILGFPSVAVSLEWGDEMNFDRAARIATRLIRSWLETGDRLPEGAGRLLNINVPSLTNGRPFGLRVASQAVDKADERYEHSQGPGGVSQYSLTGWHSGTGQPDTDLRALCDGYVVVTPLHFDLTERRRLGTLSACDWPDVTKA